MAKNSMVVKNNKRIVMANRLFEKRKGLRNITKKKISLDISADEQQRLLVEKMQAQMKLNSMPRDSSSIRVRNRCLLSGRPRGYYRNFGLSRSAFRDMALQGCLPGVLKGSW